MKQYRVNEFFYSLQGEGTNTGKPSVFVRFTGCNRACKFCDTDFKQFKNYSASEIVEEIKTLLPCATDSIKNPIHIVLTGGEPTLQVDTALIYSLITGFTSRPTIQIETNGSTLCDLPYEILSRVFLAISPKTLDDACNVAKWLNNTKIKLSCEIKIVSKPLFEDDDDLKQTLEIFDIVPDSIEKYLQPCDSGNANLNKKEIEKCVNIVKTNPKWNLSLQTHKIISIQ